MKRVEQVEGVKRILKIKDYGKQYKMVKILVEKLFVVTSFYIMLSIHCEHGNYSLKHFYCTQYYDFFQVLSKAKLEVTEFGYIPGGEFPDEQHKLDGMRISLFFS